MQFTAVANVYTFFLNVALFTSPLQTRKIIKTQHIRIQEADSLTQTRTRIKSVVFVLLTSISLLLLDLYYYWIDLTLTIKVNT